MNEDQILSICEEEMLNLVKTKLKLNKDKILNQEFEKALFMSTIIENKDYQSLLKKSKQIIFAYY